MGKRRLACKLAWSQAVTVLWGSHARMMLSGLATVALAYGAYFMAIFLGRDWPSDALIPLMLTPATMVLIAALLWLFFWFLKTPYEQWESVERRVAEIEQHLQARFSINRQTAEKPKSLEYGQVLTTTGGHKITNSKMSNELLTLPVQNDTAVTLKSCEAYLSRLERVGAEEPSHWESLRLPWLQAGGEIERADIPPKGIRSLVIFRSLGNRVHLITDWVPIGMIHFLEDQGEYEGLVTITADGAPATFVGICLSINAPEEEPKLTIIPKSEQGWANER